MKQMNSKESFRESSAVYVIRDGNVECVSWGYYKTHDTKKPGDIVVIAPEFVPVYFRQVK